MERLLLGVLAVLGKLALPISICRELLKLIRELLEWLRMNSEPST